MKKDALPPRSQPSRPRGALRLLLAGWLGVLAWATLTPGDSVGALPRSCVTCTDFWLVDVVQNVLLFVPFGWLVPQLGAGRAATIALGGALSLLVEGAQWAVPALARDPILGDWLSNLTGAALGTTVAPAWRWWTAPGPLWGRGALAVVWAACGWFGSWWLVQPDWPTDSLWYAQAAARLGHLDTLPGEVRSATVNGLAVPFVLPAAQVLAAGDPPGTMRVEAEVALAGASRGFAPAVSVYDGLQREIVVLGGWQRHAVVRGRTRSAAVGFVSFARVARRDSGGPGTTAERWCASAQRRGLTAPAPARLPQCAMADDATRPRRGTEGRFIVGGWPSSMPLVALGWWALLATPFVFLPWRRFVGRVVRGA